MVAAGAQAMKPHRKTLIRSSSRALTSQTRLQNGSSCRALTSLCLDPEVVPGLEDAPVRPQSHRAARRNHDLTSGSESVLWSQMEGSEVSGGPERSTRGSVLCRDHHVSLWSCRDRRQEVMSGSVLSEL